MKTLKIMFVCLLTFSLSTVSMAQEKTIKKNKKYYKKELAKMMDNLSPEEQMAILTYATQNKKTDAKKETLKMLKKMSPAQMEKVLNYTEARVKKNELAKMKQTQKKEVKATHQAAKPKRDVVKAPQSNIPVTTMEVSNPEYDFGVITQGEKVSFEYLVKNTGKEPLIISKAKGSCGCTVPKWPKEPIAPGETAEIKVTFSSKGKKGKQRKRVTLTANTDPVQTYLTLMGEILVEPAPAKIKN